MKITNVRVEKEFAIIGYDRKRKDGEYLHTKLVSNDEPSAEFRGCLQVLKQAVEERMSGIFKIDTPNWRISEIEIERPTMLESGEPASNHDEEIISVKCKVVIYVENKFDYKFTTPKILPTPALKTNIYEISKMAKEFVEGQHRAQGNLGLGKV